MKWYLLALKRYAQFSGRSRRQEYWMFTLFNIIIAVVLGAIQMAMGMETPVLSSIYTLIVLIPALALTVRRLHDIGRSGFWFFIIFVPLIGGLVLLVFACKQGDQGANEYGADPKTSFA